MRLIHLKVKLKSLAAEAKIIRHEERKASGDLRDSLAAHRRGIVRSEMRHSLLAYGFLRGRQYHQMEPRCHREPDWAKVRQLIQRFGGAGQPSRFDNEFQVWIGDKKAA